MKIFLPYSNCLPIHMPQGFDGMCCTVRSVHPYLLSPHIPIRSVPAQRHMNSVQSKFMLMFTLRR